MDEYVQLKASTIIFGPNELKTQKGFRCSRLTHDALKLRVKMGAELLQINLSCATIEAFEVFHDRNVGGGLVVHIYPTAVRKIQATLEPGSDAFLKYESAFSRSGRSKHFIVLDILNCNAESMNLLRAMLTDCKRYHDAHWQHKLSDAPAEFPRRSQSIEFITIDRWRDLLTSFGQTLYSEKVTVETAGHHSTYMASAIVSVKAVPPQSAIETHQDAHKQSASVHDAAEHAEANGQEGAARSDAYAAAVRVPNLRKRKGEPLTNWQQAFREVRRRPLEETREQIIQQSGGDLVVLSRKRISLTCPISGKRIKTAARGVGCTHLECFDLAAYLKQQTQAPYWSCPFAFCDQTVPVKDLIIDDYFNHALRTTKTEIKEIELQPDGLFEPVHGENADSDRVEVVVEIDDDDDVEVHANSLSPGHDLNRMLSVSAEVCEQLEVALQSLGTQLETFNFVYLNGVKESFGELFDFAENHFIVRENKLQATAVPLGIAKQLHTRSSKVFRQLNELGSKKHLNDVAHALVALNLLIN